MNFCKTALLIGAIPFLLGSCADESPWDQVSTTGKGKIKLEISSSGDITSEMPEVRSVSTEILLPDTENFKIRMVNASGTYEKTWNSLSEFSKETDFRADVYTIEGFFGSRSSQGIVKAEDAVHHHAYFYGKIDNVKVEAGKETNVQIQTQLANSIVVVEYTEEFKNYFEDWKTQLFTKGETPLDLGNEEGMCYVVPGEVDIIIAAQQQNGKRVELNPAQFVAEARHMYKLTYNIYKGEIGHADKLQIIFNDQPDEVHTVEVELSDELLSGDGPVITSEGFEEGDTLETVAGTPYDGIVKFHVDSADGFSEAILTVNSESYKPDFLVNGYIDLCKADATQQQKLANAGIRVVGLYNNPERLAMVDLTEFCRYLPTGLHEITLLVKDRSRSGSSTVSVNALPISVNASPFRPTVLGRGYAEVLLSYNGTDPTVAGANPFTFTVQNEYGHLPAQVLSIAKAEETRSTESADYVYKIAVPETMLDEYGVRIYLNNSGTPIDETTVGVTFPEYEMTYDPMARKVMMRLEKVNDPEINTEKVKDLFTNRIRLYIDDQEWSNVSKSTQTKVITAAGLPGGESFRIKTSLAAAETPENYSEEKELNYEAEDQIPNGDFSVTTKTISSGKINVGGLYTVRVLMFTDDYQNYSSIERYEANSWASLNPKTCYLNSVNKNTWYVVPSSYVDNKIYTVRTVGYNHDGPGLKTTGGGMNTNYYCETSPEKSQLQIQAGELFLGSYNFTGVNESRNEGVEFNSRPSALSFNYSYMPMGVEQGHVSIAFKDEKGKVLAEAESELKATATSYTFDESSLGNPSTEVVLPLPNYPFGEKVKEIEVKFLSSSSSSPDIYIPKGSELSEGVTVITSEQNRTKSANNYHAYSKGSVLRISDLKLNYE